MGKEGYAKVVNAEGVAEEDEEGRGEDVLTQTLSETKDTKVVLENVGRREMLQVDSVGVLTPPARNCVDDSARRRSGMSCKQLAGGYYGFNFCRAQNPHPWAKVGDTNGVEASEAANFCCAMCADETNIAIGFGGEKHYRGDLVGPRPEEEAIFEMGWASHA